MIKTIIDGYHIFEANVPIYTPTASKFIQIYQSIILQTYNIFPVPKLFIQSIIQFVKKSKLLQQKQYKSIDILNKYTKNWKYYQVFKFNFQRMTKKNIDASIKVIKFDDISQLVQIFKKYRPVNQSILNTTRIFNALIYNYNQNFNLILLVKENNSKNNQFQYFKAIQHQLIHWMQVVLNAESYTTYGKFNNVNIKLSTEDLIFLFDCFPKNRYMQNTVNYLLDGFQFQPWCANAIQNFQFLKLDINDFKNTIQNKEKFRQLCKNNKDNQIITQLYLFSQICYLASKINPADDRYWYLIEAIKENNKL